jgi:hypothetical protein
VYNKASQGKMIIMWKSSRLKEIVLNCKHSNHTVAKITHQALGHSIIDPLIYHGFYKSGVFKKKALFIVDESTSANRYVLTNFGRESQEFLQDRFSCGELHNLPMLTRSMHDTSGIFHDFNRPFHHNICKPLEDHIKSNYRIPVALP